MSLSHETVGRFCRHLIVLPVASTTCRSGSGRWQAAAPLRRANHDNHSPLGRRRFTNLSPRCDQREDYQLAVGSLCPEFTASAAKPSDCVVFLRSACHVHQFFIFLFFSLQVALLRDSSSGLIELIHLRRASGCLEQNEYRRRSFGGADIERGNGVSLANSCQDMLYAFSSSCP